MIVVRILGGLGNQMFQYAFGRCLSARRGEPLRLDTSAYATYALHGYALDQLALDPVLATAEDVRALTAVTPGFPENVIPRRLLPRFLRRGRRYAPTHIREVEGFRFDPSMLATPLPAYFDGYWQSALYFEPVADAIRADFAVRAPLAGRNAELAEAVVGDDAVSIHVRRGDYANDENTRAVHGLCSLDYYRVAVEYIQTHVPAPRWFVFSDDPAWAAEHLKLPGTVVGVDHNGAAHAAEDLRLMSRCRHHVIANSSFSWWGAWLDPRPDKIVVAPRRWMADPTRACPDVCPPTWVRLG
ncbi:MAG: alpha-1,2-fucosyltransferase [Planctomycetota bacterium]|nr:alpha-1,2-fucosyltransferase [Planctomycetota bacterium]